jgi:predicted dehydrogenase
VGVLPSNTPEKTKEHASLIREFLDCLKTGETPETICNDNIKSLALVFAAIESAKSRKLVKVTV